jgi:hypothetical protein
MVVAFTGIGFNAKVMLVVPVDAAWAPVEVDALKVNDDGDGYHSHKAKHWSVKSEQSLQINSKLKHQIGDHDNAKNINNLVPLYLQLVRSYLNYLVKSYSKWGFTYFVMMRKLGKIVRSLIK